MLVQSSNPDDTQMRVAITAVEDDTEEDFIPGPIPGDVSPNREHSSGSQSTVGNSGRRSGIVGIMRRGNKHRTPDREGKSDDEVFRSSSADRNVVGKGAVTFRDDLDLSTGEFAAGCSLLKVAAQGDSEATEEMLKKRPDRVNFRDYDRRTAMHVAASGGHLEVCKILAEKYHASLNLSDRWGGTPLDDAYRCSHSEVIQYLSEKGATTAASSGIVNLIEAAANGDYNQVKLQLAQLDDRSNEQHSSSSSQQTSKDNPGLDLNKGDYDRRTALHLAAGEGHADIVEILLAKGAKSDVLDRWGRTPLDDALDGGYEDCVKLLERDGAKRGANNRLAPELELDGSGKRIISNMEINFQELQMIERIGAGAFGEIYKCRWRGTLVAAKIIKTTKIRHDWLQAKALQNIKDGGDVDDAVRDLDEADLSQSEKELALSDFRTEISVVKSLRHPNIVLMLAYSTTERYECLISELCKCSLLDVFKAHNIQGTRMPKRTQFVYAQQLAQGMNYLHTCNPPIIHRDIKPANLLIDHSGILKISDFGLSKIRPSPGEMESDTFKMTGETGSYRFMAPEVFRHEKYNETVDIYSFAMIFYYLLVGRPPWSSLAGLEAVRLASNEKKRPGIPRELDARSIGLLKECWHENPISRPSFQKILDFFHVYMKDVFRSDMNKVAIADSPEEKQTCQCVIL